MAGVFENDKRIIMVDKLKVVWVCHFSDSKTRKYLERKRFSLLSGIHKILGKQYFNKDFAIWIPNAIKEFEKFNDVELSIIFPHRGVRREIQTFNINGIHYYCYRSEDDNLLSFFIQHALKRVKASYSKNRKVIKEIIKTVSPDVVHVIGAENPYYSLAALDAPKGIPLIVSLQTLMSDTSFKKNYPIRRDLYDYRSKSEIAIIERSDYIGTRVPEFREFIVNRIKPQVKFLDLTLAVGVDVNKSIVKKEYDFVYFAANISKACDDAIEAFAIAKQVYPSLTLNISGGYSASYKDFIDNRAFELGIKNSIFFSGSKATHNEVIEQIMKSKYALLPLKIDLISGTIREAMACGLPVVTTITPATPRLNEKRESVLLSKKGDHQAMAENMIKLLNDNNYADMIKNNAYHTVQEEYSNKSFMEIWRDSYFQVSKIK